MESKCPDEPVHSQDYLNLRILRMLECTFSLDTAHLMRRGTKLNIN